MGARSYRIVLTGGPCSGKTTALPHLKEHFESQGFKVLIAPETATMLIKAGCSFFDPKTTQEWVKFESNLLKTMMSIEDSLVDSAQFSRRDSIILYDRGSLDGAGFMEPEDWASTLRMNSWSEEYLLKRYDAVIHLVSTAVDARQFYTTENNAARHESADQSAVVDEKIKRAWEKHNKHIVIDNSTDFPGKISRTIKAIEKVVKEVHDGN